MGDARITGARSHGMGFKRPVLLKSSLQTFKMTETYDLFFTGKDDPRTCVIIGEDTKPVFFSFETFDRDLTVNTRTIVGTEAGTQGGVIIYLQVTRGKDLLASLEWSPGNHLGMAIVGTRRIPMSHLVLPSPTNK